MKKNEQDTNLLTSDDISKNNLETDKIKTTNVNILLNRVRLDKKRALKKRIFFSMFVAIAISSLIVYFVI